MFFIDAPFVFFIDAPFEEVLVFFIDAPFVFDELPS